MTEQAVMALEVLPIRTTRDDWRGYAEADTREEAMAILGGTGPDPAIWVQKDLVVEQGALLGVPADAVFFRLGETLLSWTRSRRELLEERDGLVVKMELTGLPRPVIAGWFQRALYVWRYPADAAS